MSPLGRILLLLLLGAACAQAAHAGELYRVELQAKSIRPELAGLALTVYVAERTPRGMALRVGYRNLGPQPFTGKISAPDGTPQLGQQSTQHALQCTGMAQRLMKPDLAKPGLLPSAAIAGTLLFELRSGDDGAWMKGPLTLTVPPFLPLTFSLDPAHRMDPISVTDVDFSPMAEMQPLVEATAHFPVKLETVKSVPEGWECRLSVTNAARVPLIWHGKLSAKDLRLVTEESELLEPREVSGGMAQGLAPPETEWHPGVTFLGRAVFPRPASTAAGTLTLMLPGYQPLTLLHQDGQWRAVARAAPAEGTAADEVRAEQARFESLRSFWLGLGQKLRTHDQSGFLEAFAGNGTRQHQATSLAALVRVPVAWIDFELPGAQHPQWDDTSVRGLRVEQRFRLTGMPLDSEFVTRLVCDLKRANPESPWQIDRYEVTGHPPFWELGFTEVLRTDHFLVFYPFHRDDGASRARSAARQLEQGWQRLKKTRVPIGDRYPAFVIPTREAFQALTGRDPGSFAGAMSSYYALREGELRAVNQALFLNDSHYGALQRFWGSPDRQQTIEHELVHLALADASRPWTPPWLVEGVAMYFARQIHDESLAFLRDHLPRERMLSQLSWQNVLAEDATQPEDILVQYQYSGAAVLWLERRLGEEGLLKFYEDFAQRPPDAWKDPTLRAAETAQEPESLRRARVALADEMLRRWLDGWSMDQVDAAVRVRLRSGNL
ncbi:MAG: hypothetical protein KDK99_02945 [Verrucomicrobiales bacterium]|nr:hypothetical protein [Verrucomicrobiales bacterium]